MPDQRCLLAFDLAFAPDVHVFTVTSHFDNWMRTLEELKTASTFELILSGHGEPTGRSALDATIAYLRTGKEAYSSSKEPDVYASRMKAAFSQRQHANWIEISASLLYGVIDAYNTEP
jgi:glyoxylase-like metal-dependent hydrolase (beta-lactamase superfamily II)